MLSSDLEGRTLAPFSCSYTDKDIFLYALSVGCGVDELDFLYEGRGPKVLPTFAVVPPFPTLFGTVLKLGLDLKKVVHGEQEIILHGPIPPQANLENHATVSAIKDTGKHGILEVTVRTCYEDTEDCLFTTIWTILVRGEGGFGGDPGEKRKLPDIQVLDRPIFHYEFVVPEHQALLYRLNGDRNPLHADPDFAKMARFEKPILHGLCTYGYTGRAVLAHLDNEVDRFQSLWSRFTAPVFPGETLIVEGFEQPEGKIFVRTHNGTNQQVLVGEAQISE